ncbi:MAG: hypothetical protein ACJATI_004359, partial [Halioglobus sp.]
FLHKNALSQKRSEYRPLGLKNFGECSIRLRWGSQNLGSFLLDTLNNRFDGIVKRLESSNKREFKFISFDSIKIFWSGTYQKANIITSMI